MMPKESHQVAERRTQTREVVEKLLAQRQEMWVLYCRVAGLEPYQETGPAPDLLEEFCQLLVDYVAAGHFGVYQRIIEGRERRHPVTRIAEQVYPRLAEVSQILVDFNDKYGGQTQLELSDEFKQDLSSLGERLAERIELEDQLISGLRTPLQSIT